MITFLSRTVIFHHYSETLQTNESLLSRTLCCRGCRSGAQVFSLVQVVIALRFEDYGLGRLNRVWELMAYHISIRHRAPLSWDGKGLRSFRWRAEMKSCEHKCNIGASIIRIGFRGPLYYVYNEETPQNLFKLLRPL